MQSTCFHRRGSETFISSYTIRKLEGQPYSPGHRWDSFSVNHEFQNCHAVSASCAPPSLRKHTFRHEASGPCAEHTALCLPQFQAPALTFVFLPLRGIPGYFNHKPRSSCNHLCSGISQTCDRAFRVQFPLHPHLPFDKEALSANN